MKQAKPGMKPLGLPGVQLAATIHARACAVSDVENSFMAPGIRKLNKRIVCLIHSTS
jgi:hypothetical protein